MSEYKAFLTVNSYQKVIDLLTNLFSNGWILETGSKDPKFSQHFSKLLSILDYFEENCNFSKEKYFSNIELYVTKFFDQGINIQKYEVGTVKDYFVNLTVKTLINYCINILNVDKKILFDPPKVSLDTSLKLVKNKIENLKNANTDISPVSSEKAKDFPEHVNSESKTEKDNHLNPSPTTSPYGPLNRKPTIDLKNFYPYTSKPKIIISIKKWIGILAIVNTILSIVYLGFLLGSDFGWYSFEYMNSINKDAFPDFNTFLQGYVTGIFLFSAVILFRGLYNFFFLPSSDALKYRFPIWTSILFFVVLFLSFSNFFTILKGLLSKDLHFDRLLNSFKYFAIVLIFLVIAVQMAIFILSIVGMFNNPTVDINLIKKKIENASNQNNQNNENSFIQK